MAERRTDVWVVFHRKLASAYCGFCLLRIRCAGFGIFALQSEPRSCSHGNNLLCDSDYAVSWRTSPGDFFSSHRHLSCNPRLVGTASKYSRLSTVAHAFLGKSACWLCCGDCAYRYLSCGGRFGCRFRYCNLGTSQHKAAKIRHGFDRLLSSHSIESLWIQDVWLPIRNTSLTSHAKLDARMGLSKFPRIKARAGVSTAACNFSDFRSKTSSCTSERDPLTTGNSNGRDVFGATYPYFGSRCDPNSQSHAARAGRRVFSNPDVQLTIGPSQTYS